MSYNAIHKALRWALHGTGLAVAWENVAFDPESELWIRPAFQPNDAVVSELGSGAKQRRTGIYQVSVFTPEGVGSAEAESALATIEAAYPVGGLLMADGVGVRIQRVVRVEAVVEPGWYQVPLLIYWREMA